MKQLIKTLFMLLLMSISFFAKGQGIVTIEHNVTGAGTTTGAGSYDASTTVTLTAATNPNEAGTVFLNWVVNGVNMGTNPTLILGLIATDMNVVANFSTGVDYGLNGLLQDLHYTGTTTPVSFNPAAKLNNVPVTNSFYRNRIIAGDPNGTNITSQNLFGFWRPFQLSTIQGYGGNITIQAESKSAVAGITNNPIGISNGYLANSTNIWNIGVQGESFLTSPVLTNNASAGGFFRLSVPAAAINTSIIAGMNSWLQGAAPTAINRTNSVLSSIIGVDLITDYTNVITNTYAAYFRGRGYFSNRVGIGPSQLLPLATDANNSNAEDPTDLLHIDGRFSGAGTPSINNRVLRVQGLEENNIDTVLVIRLNPNAEDGTEDGRVFWRTLPPIIPPTPMCTTNAFNVNHVNAATNAFVCGRIWDNGGASNGGQISLNTPTAIFANLTGVTNGSIRTDGRFQMNGITQATSAEVLGIRATNDPLNPSEIVRFTLPSQPPTNCGWLLRGNDDVTSPPRTLINIGGGLCQINNNNFIGTRPTVSNNNETGDLVFATRGNGWMRLTTAGGLFLTDNNIGATSGNIRIGMFAQSDATGNDFKGATTESIFIGQEAGRNTISASAPNVSRTICIGLRAGMNNTNGGYHGGLFLGNYAGFNNVGTTNVIIGSLTSAPARIITGGYNTLIGHDASFSLTSGSDNTFLGNQAGMNSSQGSSNTFVGRAAGLNNLIGANNTFVGRSAGQATTGSNNSFFGFNSGANSTVGTNNVFLGFAAGAAHSGNNNVMIGSNTGHNGSGGGPKTGSNNTFIGTSAGSSAGINSVNNVYIGVGAGSGSGTSGEGNNNVAIGNSAGVLSSGGIRNNYIAIGNSTRIGGDSAISISPNYTTGLLNNIQQSAIGIGVASPNHGERNKATAYSVSIGYESSCSGALNPNCIAMGTRAYTNGPSSIALGNNARVGTAAGIQSSNIAIGTNSFVNGTAAGNAITLGTNSYTDGVGSIAIGNGAKAAGNLRMSIGGGALQASPTDFVANNLDPTISIPTIPINVGIGIQDPTTRLHVNCSNPTTNPIPANRSAVRFQGLQPAPLCSGTATARQIFNLIIDNEGYIYQSTTPICANGAVNGARSTDVANTSKTDSLQKRIEALEQKLTAMENVVDKCCTKTGANPVQDFPINNEIKLYQNVPNPFTEGTEIKFFVPETVGKASLVIYDLNGREIRKIDINDRNESIVKIYGKELAAGMYIYTLIADNKEVDSKRMILTGN